MRVYCRPGSVLGVKDPSTRFSPCHPRAQSLAPEKNKKYLISLCNNAAIRISEHQDSREKETTSLGLQGVFPENVIFLNLQLIQISIETYYAPDNGYRDTMI